MPWLCYRARFCWQEEAVSRQQCLHQGCACHSVVAEVTPCLDLGCDCPCPTCSQVQMVSTEGRAFLLSLHRCQGLQILGECGEEWSNGIPLRF